MAHPPVPFTVRAIAPYQPASETEMALVTGETYLVTNTDGKGIWLQSQVNGVYGWFPLSYTEVVQEVKPERPLGEGKMVKQKSMRRRPATNKTEAKVNKGAKPGPPVRNHIEKNKKCLPTTVYIQVVEALLVGEVKKSDPTAWLFMKSVMDGETERKFESTEMIKKTLEPRWNEAFTMVSSDPEGESVVIRIVNGKTYDKRKVLGEVEFTLRSSVRDFDAPAFKYDWFPLCIRDSLSGGRLVPNNSNGKVRALIQFIDNRETAAPTNFKRVGHVGWSSEAGFDISNVPPEWKAMFKQAGIKKHHLTDNKDLAADVFNIMNNASTTQGGIGEYSKQPSVPTISQAPAPPPPIKTFDDNRMDSVDNGKDSISTLPSDSYPIEVVNQIEPEQPVEEDPNDFLAAIRRGTQLAKVDPSTRPSGKTVPDGDGDLCGLLKRAMVSRVKATGDEADDDSSDDDWDD